MGACFSLRPRCGQHHSLALTEQRGYGSLQVVAISTGPLEMSELTKAIAASNRLHSFLCDCLDWHPACHGRVFRCLGL